MLGDANIQPTIGVASLEEATAFYGGVLGLRVVREDKYTVMYQSGDSTFSIYVTDLAGTNEATYATWEVDDLNDSVAGLHEKGVVFEQYDDIEGITRDGDIHIMDGERAAWFKDPDGNILCLHQYEVPE